MLICVGIPSIDGKPCAHTVDSLLAEQIAGFHQGVHLLVIWEIRCSLIGAARNKLAKKFLESPADCLVMVDADISWKHGALIKLAQRPQDVIGATYRPKLDEEQYHVRGNPEAVGDLYRVDGIPGGFMKISRSAFGRIDAPTYRDVNGAVFRDFFPTGMHNGELYGEDYGFCRQWRESGGDVWLDPDIELKHHDSLRSFTGNPRAWLESIAMGEAA